MKPQERFEELLKDEYIFDLLRLESGFNIQANTMVDMNKIYQEFTPKTLKIWEDAVEKKPDAQWNYNNISDLLISSPSIARQTSMSLFGKPKELAQDP